MAFGNTGIDENGYVILNPLIQINLEKKADVSKYNRVYHREYYRKVLSVKAQCPHSGSMVTKDKLNNHQKTARCLRLREAYQQKNLPSESD